MKTVRAAAKWLDGVGVAALLPGADLVLPSLWEAITGTRAFTTSIVRLTSRLRSSVVSDAGSEVVPLTRMPCEPSLIWNSIIRA